MRNAGFSLLRVLAVIFALGGVSAYVGFRHHQSSRGAAAPAEGDTGEGGEDPGRTLMVGSKSPGGSLEVDLGAAPPATEERTILPGSKSGWVIPPNPPTSPSGSGNGEAPRTVLPGSKSISPLLERPQRQEPRREEDQAPAE